MPFFINLDFGFRLLSAKSVQKAAKIKRIPNGHLKAAALLQNDHKNEAKRAVRHRLVRFRLESVKNTTALERGERRDTANIE